MTLWRVIFRNVSTRRSRSGLTVLGIAIGIFTVTALVALADGLRATVSEMLATGGADVQVFQAGVSDGLFSSLDDEELALIESDVEVAEAEPVLMAAPSVEGVAYLLVFGLDPASFLTEELTVVDGRLPQDGTTEAIVGSIAAANLEVTPGDTYALGGENLTIVGVTATGGQMYDGAVFLPLGTAQRVFDRGGSYSFIAVRLVDGADSAAFADRIESAGEFTVVAGEEDYGSVDQGYSMINGAAWAIAVLAVGIGAIGVMNTMIMSVLERTREIGVLRAIGWPSGRVLAMVFGEAALLNTIALVIGFSLGILALEWATGLPSTSGLLAYSINGSLVIKVVSVATLVTTLGALYPALRATRLRPVEALRYE